MAQTKAAQRRYPPEIKERAVRLVLETIEASGERYGVINRVARQLGIGKESLRKWVERAEVDDGRRAGTTTRDQERIKELEREIRELRRSNEILRTASAFFARELDPREVERRRKHRNGATEGPSDRLRLPGSLSQA